MPFYFGGNEAENEGKGLVLNDKNSFKPITCQHVEATSNT